MRAQDSDVIGDGLGVGGADTDVDHGDAGTIGAFQMIGRHLRQARRRGSLREAFARSGRPAGEGRAFDQPVRVRVLALAQA